MSLYSSLPLPLEFSCKFCFYSFKIRCYLIALADQKTLLVNDNPVYFDVLIKAILIEKPIKITPYQKVLDILELNLQLVCNNVKTTALAVLTLRLDSYTFKNNLFWSIENLF